MTPYKHAPRTQWLMSQLFLSRSTNSTPVREGMMKFSVALEM